jgi:hypothetical protein
VELCFASQELITELLHIVADVKACQTLAAILWGRHFKSRETILSVNTKNSNDIVKELEEGS